MAKIQKNAAEVKIGDYVMGLGKVTHIVPFARDGVNTSFEFRKGTTPGRFIMVRYWSDEYVTVIEK